MAFGTTAGMMTMSACIAWTATPGHRFMSFRLRSGQGVEWDGLSKYDLTKYNPWYFSRVKQFADLCDHKGLVLINQQFFQHNIIEAGATGRVALAKRKQHQQHGLSRAAALRWRQAYFYGRAVL